MSDPTPSPDSPSKSPMRFRRTRIAVSLFVGLLTLALTFLWMRSYWWADSAIVGSGYFCQLVSYEGKVSLTAYPAKIDYRGLFLNSGLISDSLYNGYDDKSFFGFLFSFDRSSQYLQVIVPYYFLLPLTLLVVSAASLPLTFSLRALLIATTLIAVVLGLGVWLVR